MSCQESPNTASSGHCHFSSGKEFSLTKKANKPELMKQCGRQASKIKNIKLKDVPIPIFHYAVNLIWCGRNGEFKA